MQKPLFVFCYIIRMTLSSGNYPIMVKSLGINFNYGRNFLLVLYAHDRSQVFQKLNISIKILNISNLLCKKLIVSKLLNGNTKYFNLNSRFLVGILGFSF